MQVFITADMSVKTPVIQVLPMFDTSVEWTDIQVFPHVLHQCWVNRHTGIFPCFTPVLSKQTGNSHVLHQGWVNRHTGISPCLIPVFSEQTGISPCFTSVLSEQIYRFWQQCQIPWHAGNSHAVKHKCVPVCALWAHFTLGSATVEEHSVIIAYALFFSLMRQRHSRPARNPFRLTLWTLCTQRRPWSWVLPSRCL